MMINRVNRITPSKKARNSAGSMATRKTVYSKLYLLPDALLINIFSYFVSIRSIDIDSFFSLQVVDRRFHSLITSSSQWRYIPTILSDGSLNINSFSFISKKNKGTEGTCYHARKRFDGVDIALKRARVYPDVSELLSPLHSINCMFIRTKGSLII
jgi:hypothetical protein